MTPFPVDALFESLANWIWRGILLTGVAALVLQFLRRRTTAAERYAVLFAVLLVLAAGPFLETALLSLEHAEPLSREIAVLQGTSGGELAALHVPADEPGAAIQSVLASPLPFLIAWLAIAILGATRLCLRCRQARALKSDSTAPPVELAVELRAWEGEFRARRRAETRMTSGIDSPGVVGWVRPAVLMPHTAVHSASQDDIRLLWRHEREHIARMDDWTQLLAEGACALMWFHPAAHWIKRRLDEERELACDEAVVRSGAEPGLYAGALGRWAERRLLSDAPAGVVAIGRSKAQIIRRIEMLLSPSRILRPGATRWTFAVSLATAAVFAASLSLGGPVLVRAQSETAAEPTVRVEVPVAPEVTSEIVLPAPLLAQAPSPEPAVSPEPEAARESRERNAERAVAQADRDRETEEEQAAARGRQFEKEVERWRQRIQPQIEEIQREAARIQEIVAAQIEPRQREIQELAAALAERHADSIAPLAMEMGELGLKMAAADSPEEREELRRRMSEVAEEMKQREPEIRRLGEAIGKIEIDMAPVRERIEALHDALEEKHEAVRAAEEELREELEERRR